MVCIFYNLFWWICLHVSFQLHALSDDGVSDLEDPVLAPLKDTERFGIVQRLFASADINLERLQPPVKVATRKAPNVLPRILYVYKPEWTLCFGQGTVTVSHVDYRYTLFYCTLQIMLFFFLTN